MEAGASCSSTPLAQGTITALEAAFSASSDSNEYIRDISRTLACDPLDATLDTMNIVLQVGQDCFTHVHRDHLSVYDFSGW